MLDVLFYGWTVLQTVITYCCWDTKPDWLRELQHLIWEAL